ncbi:hypothetical protein SISNIDRAFT_489908 [Sistotremastrum niveocremeum HHB9708]|uniref:F-box domain-containing protein n=1 Tax=Sistotremastrum niveocremeum HHB9708 TaxID=1314777 RepID=A0A164PF43_9AGAM|nr:hypothetical protein SISNIDRAFT_489908 [Sistotremastrum niveocremeum HHB9708]
MAQFNNLALELVLVIMMNVGVGEIVSFSQTCSRYRQLVMKTEILGNARDSDLLDLPLGITLQTIDPETLFNVALDALALRHRISFADRLVSKRSDFMQFDESRPDPTPIAICHDVLLFPAYGLQALELVILSGGGHQRTISVPTPIPCFLHADIAVIENAVILAFLVGSEGSYHLHVKEISMDQATFGTQTTHVECIVPALGDLYKLRVLIRDDHACVLGTQRTQPDVRPDTSFFACNWRKKKGISSLAYIANTIDQSWDLSYSAWADFSPIGNSVLFRHNIRHHRDPHILVTELLIPDDEEMYPLDTVPVPEPTRTAINPHPFICLHEDDTSSVWLPDARVVRMDDTGNIVVDVFADHSTVDSDSDSDSEDFRAPGGVPGTVERFTIRDSTLKGLEPEVKTSRIAVKALQSGLGSRMESIRLYPNRGQRNRHRSTKPLMLLAQAPHSLSEPRWLEMILPDGFGEAYRWRDIDYFHFDVSRGRLLMLTMEGILRIQY